jgi:hypothetical protein
MVSTIYSNGVAAIRRRLRSQRPSPQTRGGEHMELPGPGRRPVRAWYRRAQAAAKREALMRTIIVAAVISLFTFGCAGAQESCAAKAVGKDGKPLSGAAKTSSMKACCEKSAIDKNGAPMKGIVKENFIKSCMAG